MILSLPFFPFRFNVRLKENFCRFFGSSFVLVSSILVTELKTIKGLNAWNSVLIC